MTLFMIASEDCDIENGTTIEANLEDIYSRAGGFDFKAIDKLAGFEVDKIVELDKDYQDVGEVTWR